MEPIEPREDAGGVDQSMCVGLAGSPQFGADRRQLEEKHERRYSFRLQSACSALFQETINTCAWLLLVPSCSDTKITTDGREN